MESFAFVREASRTLLHPRSCPRALFSSENFLLSIISLFAHHPSSRLWETQQGIDLYLSPPQKKGVTRDRSPLNWLASGGIPFSTKPFQKLCLPTFPTTQVLVSKWTFIRKQVWEISLSRRSSLLTNPYLLCEDCQSVSFYSGHRLSSTPRLISLNLLEATPMLNNLQKFCVQIYFFRNTPSVT